jgi:hypothetical protein
VPHRLSFLGKGPQYPLNRRLAGSQSLSGYFEEEKNLLSLQKFESQIIQPVAYDCKLRSCSVL